MAIQSVDVREEIERLLAQWRRSGLPSHAALNQVAARLQSSLQRHGGKGLWNAPPLMATATLDDGLGQGLMVIHQFAEAVGMRIRPLGLLRSVEHIISDCHNEVPDFLGLTVLQFDSQADLAVIARNMPPKTRMICGGPVFQADPDFAGRCGVHYVARDVSAFLDILLRHSKTANSHETPCG